MAASIADRLAPELREFASARTSLDRATLDLVRAGLNARRAEAAPGIDTAGVLITDQTVPGEGRGIGVRIYRGGGPDAPTVLFCHSGAFVLGNLDTDHRQCVQLARGAGCTVVSVDYRLAPEHPYPAGLADCLEVLVWAAERLPGPLAVAGSSAGAGLAATLAQRSVDGAAPAVVFQLLHQPVLDDRGTPAKAEFVDTPGFDGPAAAAMWQLYLGRHAPDAAAVPARREQLAALAPAFISCSELDPLRDEALDYAGRLARSGVAVELHLWPGTCHGFDSLAPDWPVSRRLFELQGAALRTALAPAPGPPRRGTRR